MSAAAPASVTAGSYGHDELARIASAAERAIRRIAPLWPLRNFVAVNPFLGSVDTSFEATCASMHRVARVEMLMPRSYYREAIEHGTIAACDLDAALRAAPAGWNVPPDGAALRAAIASPRGATRRHPAHVPTVAETLDDVAPEPFASGTRFMIDEISKFCASYFDESQAVWRVPRRDAPLFESWRRFVASDRNPEIMGIRDFRALIAGFPGDPVAAIAEAVRRQGVPDRALADYLHQALISVGGWAAYARYRLFTAELYGTGADSTLLDLLAVRIVWGYTLFAQHREDAFTTAWADAMRIAALEPADERLGDDRDLTVDLIAHDALERAYRRRLFARLASAGGAAVPAQRPPLQAAFCIDVRSEVMRRALEAEFPPVQTLGFAGFFGFPIEYVPLGQDAGRPQCPVLLVPRFRVAETVSGAPTEEVQRVATARSLRRQFAKAWKSFKTAAVASFVFVETVGLSFALKLVSDATGTTRPVRDPTTDGIDARSVTRLGPQIARGEVGGQPAGFAPSESIDMAEAVLRGMSLTHSFAPIVLLVGHGSTTVNNPHSAGLDCGACGGHTGEANARVAAAILNENDVRAGLRARGIDIPADTWFVPCLHDTTTDDVRLFDTAGAPPRVAADLGAVRDALARASARTRRERAPALGIPVDGNVDRNVIARSRDWSQVRPEWGLAGAAAFIAAPRYRTASVDLEGRAFLHDYDWRVDTGFATLELIMTAPMVVASWISLQYYGSTVNNPVFGSGNKTLHNVAGGIGVLEGNAGDLKTGLAWQSVHDGVKFVHEPLRLSVIIAAPADALDAVIEKHAAVRQLVENRWLHLFRMDDDGQITQRGDGAGRWLPVS